MTTAAQQTDQAFPVMVLDILGRALVDAGDPLKAGGYLTKMARELTGAKCSILVQYLDASAGSEHRVLNVHPPRRKEWAESDMPKRLFEHVYTLKGLHVLRASDFSEEECGLFRQEECDLSLAVPLNIGACRMGALLVLGLPDARHIDQVINLFRALSTPVALVLRNAFLAEKQEQIIRQRTQTLLDTVEEQKRTANELRESEARFRTLANCGQAFIWTSGLDMRCSYLNQPLLDFTGRTPDQLLGEKWAEAIHPEDRLLCLKTYCQAFSRQENFCMDFRLRRHDGEYRWIQDSAAPRYDAEGNFIGYIGHGVDITERKQAEAEHERLIAAIEQSGETIVITDPQGIIQYVNPAFEKESGYTREEAVGHKPDILKSGRQDAAFYGRLWSTITSGKTWQGRIVNRRKNGELYTEEATISPVSDQTGKIVNFVAAKRNISEQLQLSAQLHHSQKMELIGRLAGGIAHDFNNMLSVILGHSEMALESLAPNDPFYTEFLEIKKVALRSAELTQQLLGFARKQTVSPKVIDLNAILAGMVKMLSRLIGEDIRLVWHPADGVWPVKLDIPQLNQVLTNLAVNARDAISGEGQLTIETANVTLDNAVCLPHAETVTGDHVMLSVCDDGCGMDSEVMAHIFEPFFTTKKAGAGTGLGLATVYGIVKQNNGFIDVSSAPGRGSTFKIYLPRFDGQAAHHHPLTANEPFAPGHETVLVCEDELELLTVCRNMLEKLGYRVLAANSPKEALALAERHGTELRALITDVIMPEMNGRELSKRLLARLPTLKVVFMSGYTANVIATRNVLDEDTLFLPKPFTLQMLSTKLREALDSP